VWDVLGKKVAEVPQSALPPLLFGGLRPIPGQTLMELRLDPYAISYGYVSTHILAEALTEPELFRALLAGQHMVRGFTNPDIRQILKDSPHLNGIADPKRRSAERQNHAYSQPLPRSRTHCKDSALAPLARYQTRTHRYVRSSTTTRRSVSRFPFDDCRLIPRFLCETQRRQR